jgi:hypothetical protein
LLVTSI